MFRETISPENEALDYFGSVRQLAYELPLADRDSYLKSLTSDSEYQKYTEIVAGKRLLQGLLKAGNRLYDSGLMALVSEWHIPGTTQLHESFGRFGNDPYSAVWPYIGIGREFDNPEFGSKEAISLMFTARPPEYEHPDDEPQIAAKAYIVITDPESGFINIHYRFPQSPTHFFSRPDCFFATFPDQEDPNSPDLLRGKISDLVSQLAEQISGEPKAQRYASSFVRGFNLSPNSPYRGI